MANNEQGPDSKIFKLLQLRTAALAWSKTRKSIPRVSRQNASISARPGKIGAEIIAAATAPIKPIDLRIVFAPRLAVAADSAV